MMQKCINLSRFMGAKGTIIKWIRGTQITVRIYGMAFDELIHTIMSSSFKQLEINQPVDKEYTLGLGL